jgi:sulfur-oxidizing protein SoxB
MSRRLTILQINDVHGYMEPHPELFLDAGEPQLRMLGGYARIRTLFERVRDEAGGAVLALDNGDTLHGTHAAVSTRGEALVDPLNLLGLDAMTAHWDFAYGPARLEQVVGSLGHPLLAANVYPVDGEEAAYPSHTVIERGGVRVGVVGLAAFIVDKTMPEHFSEGLRFTLGVEETATLVTQLRERDRVDVVVLLSHLGFPQDCRLAEQVPGIDVIVSGHTHNRLSRPYRVGRTLIIQSGCHGAYVGRLDLEVDGEGVRSAGHQLIPVAADIEPDAEMTAIIDRLLGPDRAGQAECVGATSHILHRGTVMQAPMDDLLLAAVAQAGETSIAFSNGWRFGAPVPVGAIRRSDLWNMVPPNPEIEVTELTGRELREMLEENLERTFSTDPYRQQGGFVKRCRGIVALVKVENPPGARLTELFVDNRPVRDQARFPVSFLTTQAVPARFGTERRGTGIRAITALEDHLAHVGEVVAQPPSLLAV